MGSQYVVHFVPTNPLTPKKLRIDCEWTVITQLFFVSLMLHAVWLTCLDHSAYLRWDLHSQFGHVLPKFSTGGAFTISFFSQSDNNNSPLRAPSQEASLCLFLHLIQCPYYMQLWTMESLIARKAVSFCGCVAGLKSGSADSGSASKTLDCAGTVVMCAETLPSSLLLNSSTWESSSTKEGSVANEATLTGSIWMSPHFFASQHDAAIGASFLPSFTHPNGQCLLCFSQSLQCTRHHPDAGIGIQPYSWYHNKSKCIMIYISECI